jgi:c-di-GMP-binding flagellar brake protein YcgR
MGQISSRAEIKTHLYSLYIKGVTLALSNKDINFRMNAFFTKRSYGDNYLHLEVLSGLPDQLIKGMPLSAEYTLNCNNYAFNSTLVEILSVKDIIISVPMGIEETSRRKNRRVDCPNGLPNEVYICSPSKCFIANFIEISEGGLSFLSNVALGVGTELKTIRIILPKGNNIQLEGVIRRSNLTAVKIQNKKYKYGVQFTAILPTEKEKLKIYLAQLSKTNSNSSPKRVLEFHFAML